MKTMCGTSKATPGWRCTRDIGHDGPCAAVPQCIHLFTEWREWQYQHNGGQAGCENFSRTCSRCGLIERAASGTEAFNNIKKELTKPLTWNDRFEQWWVSTNNKNFFQNRALKGVAAEAFVAGAAHALEIRNALDSILVRDDRT